MNRRSLLRLAVLAPLAPVAAAASQKLGSLGSGIQKMTPQLAVKDLIANYARSAHEAYRVTAKSVEYVGDKLAVVRYVEQYKSMNPYQKGMPASINPAAPSTWVYRWNEIPGAVVYNAGAEAVRYMGQNIPPGAWTAIRSTVGRRYP